MGDTTQFMNGLSGAVGTDADATASNDALLRSMAARMPSNVQSIQVWDAAGLNIGSSEPQPRLPRDRAEQTEFFRTALRQGGLATQAPLRRQKGEPGSPCSRCR